MVQFYSWLEKLFSTLAAVKFSSSAPLSDAHSRKTPQRLTSGPSSAQVYNTKYEWWVSVAIRSLANRKKNDWACMQIRLAGKHSYPKITGWGLDSVLVMIDWANSEEEFSLLYWLSAIIENFCFQSMRKKTLFSQKLAKHCGCSAKNTSPIATSSPAPFVTIYHSEPKKYFFAFDTENA